MRMERARSFVKAGTEDLGACGDAVRCWLGWWMEREPGTITSEVAVQVLRERGADEETLARVAEWFEEWEHRRYAPEGVGAGPEFRAATLGILESLEALASREEGK